MRYFPYPIPAGKRPAQLVQRDENLRALLRSVIRDGKTSRAALAREYGLSPTTVSVLIDALLRDGLLASTGETERIAAGRHPLLLEVNAAGRTIAVVSLHAEGLRLTFCDLAGNVVGTERYPTDYRGEPALLLAALLAQSGISDADRLAGICLVLADGFVADADAIRRTDPEVCWPLESIVRAARQLALPVLAGDAASFAAASVGRGQKELLYLRFDESVGLGVLHEGEIFGFGGRPPALTHLCVDPAGARCACGAYGCLGLYLGRKALLARAREMAPPDSALVREDCVWDTLAAAFTAYDPTARALFAEAAGRLASAIGTLLCLFPVTSVLLDGLDGLGEGFLFLLRRQLGSQGDRIPPRIDIRLAPNNAHIAETGAARVFFERYLPLPV